MPLQEPDILSNAHDVPSQEPVIPSKMNVPFENSDELCEGPDMPPSKSDVTSENSDAHVSSSLEQEKGEFTELQNEITSEKESGLQGLTTSTGLAAASKHENLDGASQAEDPNETEQPCDMSEQRNTSQDLVESPQHPVEPTESSRVVDEQSTVLHGSGSPPTASEISNTNIEICGPDHETKTSEMVPNEANRPADNAEPTPSIIEDENNSQNQQGASIIKAEEIPDSDLLPKNSSQIDTDLINKNMETNVHIPKTSSDKPASISLLVPYDSGESDSD